MDLVRVQVQGPAAGLLVTSVLAALSWSAILSLVRSPDYYYYYDYYRSVGHDYPGLYFLVLFPSLLVFLFAIKMGRLQSYGAASAGSILAMVPWHPTWPLGLAMGIWTLRTLHQPAVQAAFARRGQSGGRVRLPDPEPMAQQPTGRRPVLGKLRSWMRSVRYYCVDSLLGDGSSGGPRERE
jgi:hypothetical protein